MHEPRGTWSFSGLPRLRTVATNMSRLTIAAVLTYKNMLSLHVHRVEIVTHETDLSQKSAERTQEYLKRLLTKFSRQDDLALIRTAEKDSTAKLQQPHQPAQYIPFAPVIFSSQTPKHFLTQIQTQKNCR
jgi:DNA gyrase/topoisomerase IV subunit A